MIYYKYFRIINDPKIFRYLLLINKELIWRQERCFKNTKPRGLSDAQVDELFNNYIPLQ